MSFRKKLGVFAVLALAVGSAHGQGSAPVLTSITIPQSTLAIIDPESGSSTGTAGSDTKLAVGDVISFRFTYYPVPDKILRGLQGYLTEYVPPNAEVVGVRFLDPATLEERRRITVTLQGGELTQLNELEWVNGEIFANIWQQPRIARIDPATGRVTGIIDLSALAAENGDNTDSVLNGIAYDAQGDRLFVTGKYWPRLYEIDLVRAN